MKKKLKQKTPSKISENMRKLRSAKKLSKSVLVAKTGLDYHTIAKIENGRTPDPRVHTVVKIALALDTSVEKLVN